MYKNPIFSYLQGNEICFYDIDGVTVLDDYCYKTISSVPMNIYCTPLTIGGNRTSIEEITHSIVYTYKGMAGILLWVTRRFQNSIDLDIRYHINHNDHHAFGRIALQLSLHCKSFEIAWILDGCCWNWTMLWWIYIWSLCGYKESKHTLSLLIDSKL